MLVMLALNLFLLIFSRSGHLARQSKASSWVMMS